MMSSATILAKGVTLHQIARFERPPSYPARFPVPDDKVPFAIPWPRYMPTEYSSAKPPNCGADSATISLDEFRAKFKRGEFTSFTGPVDADAKNGRPCNVRGRCGLTGLGALFHWGANFAADAITIRFNSTQQRYEVLLIERKDGAWALPGGFYLPDKETSLSASLRELHEETGTPSQQLPSMLRAGPLCVYSGYADDPRNTDNAWIETSAWLFHVNEQATEQWNLEAADDAIKTRWFGIKEALAMRLYSTHATYIQAALPHLATLDEEPEARFPAKHQPLLTEITALRNLGYKRIGLFGGTFDPVHAGHLQTANNAMLKLALDAIVFIPTSQNPLKASPPMASALVRQEMLVRVLERIPHWYVSPVEISKGGTPSYTIDTVKTFHAALNNDQSAAIALFLLLGDDTLDHFSSWNNHEEISNFAQLVFQVRGAKTSDELLHLQAKLSGIASLHPPLLLTAPTVPCSSSELRQRLATGNPDDVELLPAVRELLESSGYIPSANHLAS